MHKEKCNSCGGVITHDPKQAAYYHVCPDGTENPRNENLKPNPDKPGEYVMVSEGAGVTEVE